MNNVKNILVDKIFHTTLQKNKVKETQSTGGMTSSTSTLGIGNGGGNNTNAGGSVLSSLIAPYGNDASAVNLGGGNNSTSGVLKIYDAHKFDLMKDSFVIKPIDSKLSFISKMVDESNESSNITLKLQHSSSGGSSGGGGGGGGNGGINLGGIGSGVSLATILANQSPMPTAEKLKSTLSNKLQEFASDNADDGSSIPWHKLLSLPPKQMIVVDRMHSGARRYITLDFGSPIILTDVVCLMFLSYIFIV